MERIQDEELKTKMPFTNNDLKKQLEQAQDKIFARRKLHSSSSLDVSGREKIKLIPISEVEDLMIGFYGEIKPCSGLIELYGEKWAKLNSFETDIYLTFSYDKLLSHWKKNDQGEYYVFHDELPTKITENYCLLCAKETLKNWGQILFK